MIDDTVVYVSQLEPIPRLWKASPKSISHGQCYLNLPILDDSYLHQHIRSAGRVERTKSDSYLTSCLMACSTGRSLVLLSRDSNLELYKDNLICTKIFQKEVLPLVPSRF